MTISTLTKFVVAHLIKSNKSILKFD